jgi:drug/metabolite transporter (DMT)-like permease
VQQSGKSAVAFAVMAGLLWAPHFRIVEGLRAGPAGVSPLIIQLYLVFWAAAALLVFLVLSGRLGELSAFHSRETHFLILAALGGYGCWMLQAVALESATASSPRLLFYVAPLLIGLFSVFSREQADRRSVMGLLLGFAGCIMLTKGFEGAHLWSGGLPAVGAAACWALFSLGVRPIVREERALPVAALVLLIGTACLLVTCIARGDNPFHINLSQLFATVFAGVFTVGLVVVLWLKCLHAASAATVAPFWYLGLLFGALGRALIIGGLWSGFFWLLGGTVLVLLGIGNSLAHRDRKSMSISDVLRGT